MKRQELECSVIRKAPVPRPASTSGGSDADSRAKARSRAHLNARAKAPGTPRWRPNPKYASVIRLLTTSPFVRPACEKVGCSTGAFYRDMQKHPEFRQKVEDARALGYERAEAEAFNRAMEGDEEYVVAGGRIVMQEFDDHGDPLPKPIPLKRRRRSDRMLELILKGNLRDKYGTTRAEITGKDGEALGVPKQEPEPEADLTLLSDDELNTLLRLQLKACGLPEDGGSHG